MAVKKYIIGIIFLFSTSILNAQIHGLSVSDLADSPGKGSKNITAFTFKGENSYSAAGRFAYGINDRVLLFLELGHYKHERASSEVLGQFGFRWSLPVNLPFDLSLRTTFIPYIASYEHYIELTANLIASRYLDQESKWAVYGGLGVDYQEWELEMALDPIQAAFLGQDTYIDIGDQTDPIFLLGISTKLSDIIRIFIEAAHVKEYYGCIGFRFEL